MKKASWHVMVILGQIIIIISSVTGIAIPLILKQIIDAKQLKFQLGGLLFGLFIGQALFIALGTFLMAKAGELQVLQTRSKVTLHLLNAEKSFFDHQKGDDLSSHILSDTNSIRKFLTEDVTLFVGGIVTIVGSLLALILLDWKLSLVLIGTLPVMVMVIVPISNVSERYAKRLQDETAATTSDLAESFRRIELLKANTAEQTSGTHLLANFRKLYTVSVKTDLVQAVSSPLALLLLFGAVTIIFAYGGQRVANGTLSVGTLMSFLVYVFQLLNPLGGLSEFFASYAQMKGATSKLNELKQTKLENRDGEDLVPSGDLEFKDVTFGYNQAKPILQDITLTVPLHKKVAIVGPSGGGKSTLIDLIERFYPVTDGEITYSGRNIRDFNLKRWRQNFALVSQNSNIVSGTIRDNLLFGLDPNTSEDQLKQALEQAGLLAEIEAFPEGLNTAVGENGNLLSGGQKQRIQIARAYLSQAKYIIFDEATANLDADAEHKVSMSLNQVLQNRTALIIAHRLSTIVDSDLIYFLENQHITGCGTHAELMRSHQSYRRFVSEQIIQTPDPNARPGGQYLPQASQAGR